MYICAYILHIFNLCVIYITTGFNPINIDIAIQSTVVVSETYCKSFNDSTYGFLY